MTGSSPEAQRTLVERYFTAVRAGDPDIGALFSEDAVWIAPQSSPVGRRHEGRAAVLELMGKGVGLYDMSHPMEMEIHAMAAEGEHVFVEMTLSARTLAGEAYRNHYVFVFRIRKGLIIEIREYLDTLYGQRMLFDPVGQSSPLDS
jgi:ketosteroid isomerase-like protein